MMHAREKSDAGTRLLARLCVRCVLCWFAFPLASALGSTGSAADRGRAPPPPTLWRRQGRIWGYAKRPAPLRGYHRGLWGAALCQLGHRP